MYRKVLVVMAVAALACLLLVACGGGSISKSDSRSVKSIFDMPESFWQVYSALDLSGANPDGDSFLAMQENGLDYVNYWAQTTECIGHLYAYKMQGGDSAHRVAASRLMDCFMSTWERHGAFPRPAYGEYPDGWVSSMDAPSIMVAAQMLYEITEEDKYKNFLQELIPYASGVCDEGGFNVIVEDGLWPLEYASVFSSADNAQFVLNGSLVGYVGCCAIAQLQDDPKLRDYVERVERAYLGEFSRYRYDKYAWTLYMLNPNTVIPPHYLIFEMKLFDAMYDLTGIEAYRDEKIYRSDAIKSVMKPEFTSGSDGSLNYVMARACNPHLYLIDCYGTVIGFYDESDNMLEEYSCSITGDMADAPEDFYEGAFLEGVVPEGAKTYKVFSVYGKTRFPLFSGDVSEGENRGPSGLLDSGRGFFSDAFSGDGYTVAVDTQRSEEHEARITFDLVDPKPLSENNYYAIEVDNKSSEEFAVGLRLEDSEGNAAQRSHTKLKSGKNLISFGELGFNDINQLNNVAKITLRVYTNNCEEGKYEIQLGNIYYLDGVTELHGYFKESEYKVNPQ